MTEAAHSSLTVNAEQEPRVIFSHSLPARSLRRVFLDERDQAEEVTMSASTFYKRHCTYLPAMAGWFICSAALIIYNKVWYALISLFCDHKLNVLCEVLMMIESGRIGCSNLYFIFVVVLHYLLPIGYNWTRLWGVPVSAIANEYTLF